jgi:hypothetical protein
MPFLGPWFLMGMLGLAGAAIPIVLHFFFRSRYRTVPWAAMEFLLTSIEQTARRLKFQELLLLILRCTVLLVLAFALARPALSLVGGGGRDAVDAVFIIDTSFSMGAREGTKTRFELAKSAALNALDQLPPHSTVQIYTCGNTASEPLLRDPANLDQARKVITGLELTHQATELSPAVTECVKVLKASPASNKELYVFSDLQKQGLETNASEINAQLNEAKTIATVYMVRCGTQALATAAVLDIVPQKDIPRPGQRIGFAVVVQNTGTLPIRNVQVSLAVDGAFDSAETQPLAELPPGARAVVPMAVRFEKPGLRIVTAFLSNDDLPGDNYLDRVIEVHDKVRILVVDGNLNLRDPERSSSYYLLHALSPVAEEKKAEYYLQPELVTPRQAGGELLKDKAICILTNVPVAEDAFVDPEAPTQEFLDALAGFVKKGGGLMIFGGDKVSAASYNKVLGKAGVLPLPLTDIETYDIKEGVVGINPKSAGLVAFDHFRSDELFAPLKDFPIIKTLGMQEPAKDAKAPDTARVVFRYTNGKPAIVTRKVGFGEVLVVGTSADPGHKPQSTEWTWNWLHIARPAFVPLVESMLNHLLHSQSQSYNSTVGEPLRFAPPPEMAPRNFLLVTPGDRTAVKGDLLPKGPTVALGLAQKETDRPLVVASGLARAGVYWLTTRENDPGDRTPFAIAPDLRESTALESMSEAEIDRQLGFSPVHITVKEDEPPVFAAERTNREWTHWFLWLVLGLALGESLLAWFCGRAW